MKDGGPAFPLVRKNLCSNPNCHYQRETQGFENGMTLRDYLAAKAMQSYIIIWPDKVNDGFIAECDLPQLAKYSYQIADAMLKARGATA